MARPLKEGLDYFSHDCDASDDDKLDSLEAVYGNDGYASYFKLLERIYRNKGKVFISDAETLQKYARRCNVPDVEKFEKILNLMVRVELFDKTMWENAKCLTSNGIIKRVQVVLDKRDRMKTYQKNKVSAQVISSETSAEGTQSKVKKSKVKKSKALPPKTAGLSDHSKALSISQVDIKNFRSIGMTDLWIKDHYIMLGFSESEIDKYMGKPF